MKLFINSMICSLLTLISACASQPAVVSSPLSQCPVNLCEKPTDEELLKQRNQLQQMRNQLQQSMSQSTQKPSTTP